MDLRLWGTQFSTQYLGVCSLGFCLRISGRILLPTLRRWKQGFPSSRPLVTPPVNISFHRHVWSQTRYLVSSVSCMGIRELSTCFCSYGHHLSSLISVDYIYIPSSLPSVLEKWLQKRWTWKSWVKCLVSQPNSLPLLSLYRGVRGARFSLSWLLLYSPCLSLSWEPH